MKAKREQPCFGHANLYDIIYKEVIQMSEPAQTGKTCDLRGIREAGLCACKGKSQTAVSPGLH